MTRTRQLQHEMLPKSIHDEEARQDYIQALRVVLGGTIAPANKTIW